MFEKKPQADQRDFALLARKMWTLRTNYPLRYVTQPGFFDSVIHAGIAPDDRIDVICFGDDPATHATLVVDDIGHEPGRRVRVSELVRYERAPLVDRRAA